MVYGYGAVCLCLIIRNKWQMVNEIIVRGLLLGCSVGCRVCRVGGGYTLRRVLHTL